MGFAGKGERVWMVLKMRELGQAGGVAQGLFGC